MVNVGDVGIDMSGMRLDAQGIAAAKAAGARFVIRYSAGVGNTDPKAQWKLVSPAEFRLLTAAGFDVIANSEWYESRVTEGAKAGAADGRADLAHWRACGLAKGASIYVSWDAAPSRLKFGAVRRYLLAYDKALGGYYHVDLYAGTPALRWMLAKKVIRFGWRTNAGAWSNDGMPYQPSMTQRLQLIVSGVGKTPAHIWQTGNYWFGKSADENLILRAPVGSHLEAVAASKPAPPAPKPPGPVPPAAHPVPSPTYYNAKRGNALVTAAGDRAIFLRPDGSLELRHNGAHEAWIWRPSNV